MTADVIYDLHSHSLASDGALSPRALVARAAGSGVDVLALTDHDTLAGVPEAMTAAHTQGMRLISGVEISVTWWRRTLHVVGLGVDTNEKVLGAGLSRLQARRRERARRMADKIAALGVQDPWTRAERNAQGGQITRTHFARLLIEDGHCRTLQQCFKRYLKPGKRAYAGVEWAGLEEAIGWIHAAGGAAVLAHPLAYGMTAAWRARMYDAFRDAGGDGVEVCCGNTNPADVRTSAREAVAHGLLGSAGSDFHSPEQSWLELGRLARMPDNVTPIWRHPALSRQA